MIGHLSIVFLVFSVHSSLQKSSSTSPTYVAAVVEHSPVWSTNFSHLSVMIKKNLEEYEHYVRDAAAKDADIIVFPGYALSPLRIQRYLLTSRELTTELPKPEDLVNPCLDHYANVSEIIRTISCAARASNIYVVVVALEVNSCENNVLPQCREDGLLYYGTTLAFDRLGTIIGKHRGSHLIGEPLLTKPSPAMTSTFDTDFGVRFGIISGTGIISYNPAMRLVQEYHVTDFVYTAFWHSELPFFTSLQVQSGWSRVNSVNLLVASPFQAISYGGSGIYSGKVGTRAAHIAINSSVMMVSHVEKVDLVCEELGTCPTPKPENEAALGTIPVHKGFVVGRDNLKIYKTLSLSKYYEYRGNTGTVDRNFTLCHSSLCCNYYIKMHTKVTPPSPKHGTDMISNGYLYKLATFDGIQSMRGMVTYGVQICGVIGCTGTRLSTCGMVMDTGKPQTIRTVFEKIQIQGSFPLEFAIQMPTVLDDKLRIFPFKSYAFKKHVIPSSNVARISMYTTRNATVYAFGIFGRVFERDGLPSTTEEMPED